MDIGSVSKFLRGYEFQGLTKAVTEAQLEIYKLPYKTYTQMGEKMAWTAGYTAASVAAQFAEIPFYVGLSTLRACGCFNPIPPEPPSFPSPHDNAGFMNCSIERALWDWQPELKEEMREGIADGLAEKWNIFQTVGEWCLAFSYENASKPTYYKPTFLVASEPLESGESYKSVGVEFAALRKKDKDAVLKAIYHQTELGWVSGDAKKVYRDIRALGAKLQQGNEAYLTAFKEYMKRKEEENPIEPVAAPRLAARITPPPARYVPTYQPTYPSWEYRTAMPIPSAPDWQP